MQWKSTNDNANTAKYSNKPSRHIKLLARVSHKYHNIYVTLFLLDDGEL